MSVSKRLLKEFDVEYITHWEPPKGDDLRPLIAMPNIPKPCHKSCPRNLLGRKTWDAMRKACYAKADDTCEICGDKPENLRNRHGHETYSIDYEQGTVKFERVFCICKRCHLGGTHTGRAITLYKQDNPLYPREFLLDGAEHAFTIISEYNADHPDEPPLRAYATFLDYLKCPDLEGPMRDMIEQFHIKFYMEDPKKLAKWSDWKLIIGSREYPTPYANEKEWAEAMAKQDKKDTARQAKNNFTGGAFDEIEQILKENN